MPATYTAEVIRSRMNLRMVDFDPDATTLTLVDLDPASSAECLPLADGYKRFLASLFRSVGTGTVTAFQIIGATDADGGGAVVVVQHAIGTAPDAVGDTIHLECDIEQIREVLPGATHVGVRAQLATATDECVIGFCRHEPTYLKSGLTADYIA